MNKNLHIFLFLLLGLIIFCGLKDIEPFGNQALLQPGLSFNSRDTSIISLQKDSEKDASKNQINNRVASSRRIPSAVKEREVPSYSISEDISGNLGTLSADLDSPEEIQMLNDKLDDLQSKLDEQSELFLSDSGKRKCTIPRGIYNSYNITKDRSESDGGPFILNIEEGERYDYDTFSKSNGISIGCVDGADGQDIEITCDGTNEFFNFRGCKKRCSIPEGYVINKSGSRYDSNNVEDYDTFADFNTDAGDSVSCDAVNGYISDPNDDPSINGCSEGQYEFYLRGCGRIIKNCILPDDNRERGYLLDENPIDPNGFEFNPFTKDLISDERISCADGYDISAPVTFTADGEIIDGGPSITCNADEDNIVFNGCKRKCSIPSSGLPTEGYIIESEPGVTVTYNPGSRVFDDHFSELSITCTGDYIGDASITCPDDSNLFLPGGCDKRTCSIPEGYVITKGGDDYEGGEFDFDTFNGFDSVRCATGYTSNGEEQPSSISCPNNEEVINEFSMGEGFRCLPNTNDCNLPEGRIPGGYRINDPEEREIRSDDLKFNPFNGDLLIGNDSITCADGYGDRSNILSPTEISITCDTDEDTGEKNISFDGCNKRQCSFPDSEIPEGYVANVLGSRPGDIISDAFQSDIDSAQLDYDFFTPRPYIVSINCAPGYEQSGSTEPSITCPENGENTFDFQGCEKEKCQFFPDPDREKYIIKDGNGNTIQTEGDLDYDFFTGKYLTCADNYVSYSDVDTEPYIQGIINALAYEDDVSARSIYANRVLGIESERVDDDQWGRARNIFRDPNLRPPTLVADPCYENDNTFTIENPCIKRQCNIPRGYKITKGDNTYTSGEDEIETFDYDLDGASVECDTNYESDTPLPEQQSCGDDETTFSFVGCNKRTCSIPEGYVVTVDGDQEPISGDSFDYDRFSEVTVNLSCKDNYVADPSSGSTKVSSDISCLTGNEFSMDGFNCREIKTCNPPAEGIPEGYLINERPIESDDFKFNPFNDKLLNDDISCDEENYYVIEVSSTEPTITCNADGNVLFSGCKRQCSIPDGYKITKGDNTYTSGTFDYDLDGASVECDTNYIGVVSFQEDQPCGDGETTFSFEGCNKRTCSIPDRVNYIIKDGNGNTIQTEGDLDYDFFTGKYLTCADNYVSYSDVDTEPYIQGIINALAYEDDVSARSIYANRVLGIESERVDDDQWGRARNIFRDPNLRPPTLVADPCYENDNTFTIENPCIKRQCNIPRGYKITKGDNTYTSGEDEIETFDYDLDGASVECDTNYESDTPLPEQQSCGDDETTFSFVGCNKRTCSIPEGYVVTVDGDQEPISGDSFDYDRFSEVTVNLSCKDDYISDPDRTRYPSTIDCPIGNDEFSMGGVCQNPISCNIPISTPDGYNINNDNERQSFQFNPFTNNLLPEDDLSITCTPNYVPTGANMPTIRCNTAESDIEFNGCRKRTCRIPSGGIPVSHIIRGDYPAGASFDYDHFNGKNIRCSRDPNNQFGLRPRVTCSNEEFSFSGCG